MINESNNSHFRHKIFFLSELRPPYEVVSLFDGTYVLGKQKEKPCSSINHNSVQFIKIKYRYDPKQNIAHYRYRSGVGGDPIGS